MRWLLIVTLFCTSFSLTAQHVTSDTSRILREVTVEAFATDRELSEVPAAIGYLEAGDLLRYSPNSLLPAVNILPGVRMEERSPGSFRFSIRGSSLRSPFGVRNVKVYWNGLPLTDGGGNTYLNLLDLNAIGAMEVIKGPGGSLYGAGTGGVLLMKSPEPAYNTFRATAIAGSYGLQRYIIGGSIKKERVAANVQFSHHQSEGYREQTALKKNALNADIKMTAGKKGVLSTSIFFTDLFYETPGGLNKNQFDENPRQARPPSALLGAVEAKAAVTNETFFGGLNYAYEWSERWVTTTGLYGAFTTFQNPTTRNYEDRDETNLGFRSTTEYSFESGKVTFGGEFQHFKSPIAVFDNNLGSPGAIQVRDEISSGVGLVFGQADFYLPANFFLTTGASINFLQYDFTRLEPEPVLSQSRNFEAVFSPRVALLKKISEGLSLYTSFSNGFSPPSLAEVRPSTNTFSNSLKSETGINLELGARGKLIQNKLSYDLVVYDFSLKNTIVLQRNAEEADYFINAGETSQKGVEALVSFNKENPGALWSMFKLWGSYAYQHYRFEEYNVLDVDYTGNKLTGIAPTIFSGGADFTLREKLTTNVLVNYVDHIPLNDGNSAFAGDYVLLGARIGYKAKLNERIALEIFAGVDNALDQKYSLGNDLNAIGGRYFNAAMDRNYYGGINFLLGTQE